MYFENCKSWCCFAEQKCRDLEAEEQERLGRIFEGASMLELDFWKMAYRESGYETDI